MIEVQRTGQAKQLYIDGIMLPNPIITAPMAGVTDRAFREILHRMGAGLVFTEMLSDKALTYGDKKTIGLLHVEGEQGPVGVQLCGSEPEVMAAAAQIIEDKNKETGNIGVLDINMGCPVNKIVKNGEGSRLMQRPEQAVEIVKKVVAAVKLPVTVKMRLGWDDNTKNVLDLAQRVEDAGAKAVTIHGRTRQQMYAGQADWSLIQQAASLLRVPVIGNGDIIDTENGWRRLMETDCRGIMIGRGMIGNPWLIRDLVRKTGGESALPSPTLDEMIQLAIWHLRRQVELAGEYIGVRQMRSHLPWYIKGRRGAATMRHKINQLNSWLEIEELLLEYATQQQEEKLI